MKNRSIEFGIFIMSIGLILLLMNLGLISWSVFGTLFEFWPAILIVIGINIIFHDNSIIRSSTWLLFLVALVSYNYYFGDSWNIRGGSFEKNVRIEKNAETERGKIRVSVGGTNVKMDSISDNLVEASLSSSDIAYKEDYKNGKKDAEIKFEEENFFNVVPKANRGICQFGLNDSVVWDIDIDTGAVNGTFDMSNLNVESVDIDTGAGDLDLVFGTKSNLTDVKIDAGASSLDIVVPESSGVRVKMDGALNNTNLDELGWDKNGDYYVSPNYNNSGSKIEMDVDMGVGELDIEVR